MTIVFKTPLLRNMVNSLDDTRPQGKEPKNLQFLSFLAAYVNDVTCTWTITPSDTNNHCIVLKFTNFNLEDSTDCR